MAWQEMKSTPRVQDHRQGPGPHYIRYTITFTGTAGTDDLEANRPQGGDTYSDVTGSGSLDSTGLDAEPTVIDSGTVSYATVVKCHVTCVFEGLYTV
jgi:hypothetical protein